MGGFSIGQVVEFIAERQSPARAGGDLHAQSKIEGKIKFACILNRNFVEKGQKAAAGVGKKT